MFRRPFFSLFILIPLAPPLLSFDADQRIDPLLRERLAVAMAREYEQMDRFDARVWLHISDQRLSRYLDSQRQRLNLLHLVYQEATRHGLNPDLVLAIIQVESAFDRFAVSSAGAQGLMQIMPFWRLEIGRPQDNLATVETNIRYGTVILAHYFDVAKGDMVDALARYNGSHGSLKYPERVVKAWRTRWRNKPRDELPQLQASCSDYQLQACRYR